MRTIHRFIASRARAARGARIIAAALLAVTVSLGNDSRAFAQDADQAAKARVNELFAKGREATRTGDELLARGERGQAMEAYGGAVASFLEAYGVVQSPLLLYSLGQVYRSRGEGHWALACYKQFLADAAVHESASEAGQMVHGFVPDATERVTELETALAGQQAPAASDSPLDPVGVCYPRPEPEPEPVEPEPVEPEPVDPEPEPLPPMVDPGPGSGRAGYRIGFWTTGIVAAASLAGATVTFLQVTGSLKTEKEDAIRAYQTMANDQLAVDDACGDARVRQDMGMNDALLGAVVDACDKGQSRAAVSNILQGVSLVSAVAAGYFLYKGYLQKSGASQEARALRIEPVLSPEGVGAQMMLRF